MPRHYAAIHFHQDDLYDCGWETDFTVAIPDGMASGVYGIRLRCDDTEEIVPIYLLPRAGSATAPIVFLASTFTYQIYGNHQRGSVDDAFASLLSRSNRWTALAAERKLALEEAEVHVHDVMNVFMCTGYTRDTHQYFMKASLVRPGDFIEFFAEIDLLVALSACPGGDCSAAHSDDTAKCYPLMVEIHRPREGALAG